MSIDLQNLVAGFCRHIAAARRSDKLGHGRASLYGVKLTPMFQNFDNDPDSDPGNQQTIKRIRSLRARIKQDGLDGFIIPREDEFQGEHVPAAHDRLKRLTGFSGSAGTAIVMARKAALFVDGRYILQAPQQVDTKIFDIVPLNETSPAKWLESHLKRGQTLAIDPKLHSHNAVASYRRAVKRTDSKLILVAQNIVDLIWHDQPALPETPVFAQALRLTGLTSIQKRTQIAGQLAAQKINYLLVSLPENIAWLLNIRANDVPHTPLALSFGVLHKSGRFDWYIAAHRVPDKVRAHIGDGVRLRQPDLLAADLQKRAGKRVGLDPVSTPAWFGEQLKSAEIVELDDPCAQAKACKTRQEIHASITAHEMDGVALCRFLYWFDQNAAKGGLDEIDAAQKAEALRTENGKLRDLSFDTISGTGPHGAIVHYRVTRASNRKIRPGDLYLIDSGGQYAQGTTDVTRTIYVPGKPPPKGAVAAFTRVLRGHIALAMARFPEGTTGQQLDALARAPLWAHGQDFDHGTGHGVGSYLSVHEGPQRISKGGMAELHPGMIVSNEPGYYEAGKFGIRIENLQYVRAPQKTLTGTGKGTRKMLHFEVLTLVPIDRRLIDKAQLSGDEMSWLNVYHQRVFKTISDHLDKSASAWLKRACRPL